MLAFRPSEIGDNIREEGSLASEVFIFRNKKDSLILTLRP